MKSPFRTTVFSLIAAFALAHDAPANLVQNGNFTSITYSGTLPLTTVFGEFGSGYPSTTPVPQLTVTNWSTAGYNYVFAPGTVDSGSSTGANAGQPNQAPGQFNTAAGYGNTYMWGTANGGLSTPTNPPLGGNFIAADGAYESSPITQTITGLTVGQTYVLKFYYAAAQQQGFDGDTTEKWTVSMGTGNVAGNFTTTPISLPNHTFSNWMQATFYFYAGSSTETLSFLASGTPNGEPPFSLLADVDLEVVPDISNWMIFGGFGAACILFEVIRRRRSRQAELAPAT